MIGALHEGGRRVVAAVHVLARGTEAVLDAGEGERVDVPVDEIRPAVELAFLSAGLPHDWPTSATSDDLRAVANATAVARAARTAEWANFDAARARLATALDAAVRDGDA